MDFVTLENTDKEEYRRNLSLGTQKDREQFEPFIDKKVTVETDSNMTLEGRMVIASNNCIAFMKKGQRSRGRVVTAGLFNGWNATITIRRIKEGWK